MWAAFICCLLYWWYLEGWIYSENTALHSSYFTLVKHTQVQTNTIPFSISITHFIEEMYDGMLNENFTLNPHQHQASACCLEEEPAALSKQPTSDPAKHFKMIWSSEGGRRRRGRTMTLNSLLVFQTEDLKDMGGIWRLPRIQAKLFSTFSSSLQHQKVVNTDKSYSQTVTTHIKTSKE